MINILKYIKSFFLGNENTRKLNKLKITLNKINKLSNTFAKMSKDELLLEHNKNQTRENEDLIVYGFALIREISKREINLYHYDEQILGSLVLYQGNIAEMKTGEGKTIISAPVAYVLHIQKKQVHIITANEYLAERDCKWLKPIYDFLNISTGYITSSMSYLDKLQNYRKNIIYLNAATLGHDYLKDNLRNIDMPKLIKNFDFVIIDEIDYILIDESRTPLVISGFKDTNINEYENIHKFVKQLNAQDYIIETKTENIILSEEGVNKAEEYFKDIIKNSFFDYDNMYLINGINQSLKANFILQKDKDYIVSDKQILLIDQMSGRFLKDRSFSNGLQQFIQIKENAMVEKESQSLASITFTNLFRSFKKISGMSGTCKTDEEEFKTLFNLEVIQIPTHKKMIRKDLNDRVFGKKKDKYQAVIQEIIENYNKGRPVLVGTNFIYTSEILSNELKKQNIPHNLLNAKNPYKESEIIANAGKLNAITIATNMAGRGTDILLGGQDEKEKEKVIGLNGLLVIGVERNESRRVDNQLIGRSGRQGDPGTSVFYLSCEDYLMYRFSFISNLIDNKQTEFSWLSNKILSIQKEHEKINYQNRKYFIELDNILNAQRQIIYEQRENIFEIESFKNSYITFLKTWLEKIQDKFQKNEINLVYIKLKIENNLKMKLNNISSFTDIKTQIIEEKTKHFNNIEKENSELINNKIKNTAIDIIDKLWIEHINNLESLKYCIMLRSYGQKDPMIEYKTESFNTFTKVLDNIIEKMIFYISAL